MKQKKGVKKIMRMLFALGKNKESQLGLFPLMEKNAKNLTSLSALKLDKNWTFYAQN